LLFEPRLAERHWSADTIWTEEARAEFVEPDLRPLPA
jgi:hypothetical protein